MLASAFIKPVPVPEAEAGLMVWDGNARVNERRL